MAETNTGCNVIVLRHSITGKPVDDTHDADQARELTQAGIDLALARRLNLGNPTFSFVGASPAKRAMSTSMLVAGLDNAGSVMDMPAFGIADPASSDIASILGGLFATHKYAPLKVYRDAEGGQHVMDHGTFAAAALLEAVESFADKPGDTALFVGHAVFIPSMVYALTKGILLAQKLALNANLLECEGFTFTLVGAKATNLKLLGPIEALAA